VTYEWDVRLVRSHRRHMIALRLLFFAIAAAAAIYGASLFG
jgi:hypothetical protein